MTLQRTILTLLTLALLSCDSPSNEPLLAEYLQRLSRVLETEIPAARVEPLTKMPAVRLLAVETEESTIDLLEFLQLSDCRLQRVIGARNSSLGKLAQPSQRLIYELEFLRYGVPCSAKLADAGRSQLQQKLDSALQQKRDQLPKILWQATVGSQELRSFWHVPAQLHNYPAETSSVVPMALGRVLHSARAWLGGSAEADSERLEQDLQLLGMGDGGELLNAWHLIEEQIGRGTELVRTRFAQRPLCYNGQPNERARILLNVVQQQFIAKIQPWAVALNQRRYDLLPPIRELEQVLADVEPPAYRHWRMRRDAQFEASFAAMQQHVEALQPLLEQCGLAPGQSSTQVQRNGSPKSS